MSEYTTRPSVRTIAATPQTAGAGAAAMVGLVIAGQSTSVAHDQRTSPASAAALDSPRSLREQFAAREREAAAALLAARHSPADALKMATAAALELTPFHASGASLDGPVAALIAARDVAAVERARSTLLDVIEQDHLRGFVHQLTHVAADASREVGFDTIEIRPSGDGTAARIIATDPGGRTLVSEVARDHAGEINLATEVLGVSDGSCHATLDRFDAAVERRGVRSGPPQRVTTGGVCELAFAREELVTILRRRPRRAGQPAARSTTARPSSDDADRLSRRRAQGQRTDPVQRKA
jgi:hypothetical protein